MPARRRGGGGVSGGGNASVSFLLRQAGEENKGLLFSSPRIDETGHLRGESKGEADPALGGHVDLPIFAGPGVDRHGALRLQFPADITGFAGADSNNIVVRLFRNDSFVRTPTVTWNAASGLLLIILSGTVVISDIRTAIDGLSGITIANSPTGAATGSDNLVVPGSNGGHVNHNAQGGRDEIPPGIDLLAQPDDEVNGPNILVKYDPADETTLQALLDELEENDQGVTIKVPFGTDLTAAPEAVPFVRVYQGNIAESPSTGTGGLTQGQVDGRVRALSKASALRGGPPVPVSDLPGADALDAEVPGLVEGAAETQAPDGHQDDELLFIGRSGGLKKATTQTFRQLFKGYVGAWPVAAGFVFRPGDITDHTGRFYIVNTRHVVDTTDGPETNLNYTPLDNWVGTIAQGWYRAGSTGIYQGGVYAAIADVVNTDALPGGNHPKWLLISQDSREILDGGTYRSASTYKGMRIVRKADAAYLTLRDVPAGIDPGVSTSWTDYYYRLGWVDGAPDSLVGAPSVNGSGELVTRTRGGHENRVQLPSGGTTVGANPAGTDGDPLTRIAVAGRNYYIPQGYAWYARPTLSPPADISSDTEVPSAGSAFTLLDAETIQGGLLADVDFTTEWFGCFEIDVDTPGGGSQRARSVRVTLVTTHSFNGKTIVHERPTDVGIQANQIACIELSRFNSISKVSVGSYRPPDGNADGTDDVDITAADLAGTVDISYQLKLEGVNQNGAAAAFTIETLKWMRPVTRSYQIVHGEGGALPGPPPPTVRPSISSFTLRSGDQTPVAGSIAAGVYGVDWAIAQSDHVGAARIIGFKGDFDGTNGVILNTIPAGNYAHGSGNVTIPNGTSLAADETYTLRIQVFGEGVTNPALAATPAGSQDIVITAHAAATANVHWGAIAKVDGRSVAATVAAIDFATDDDATGAALARAYTAALPDDGSEYQVYLAVAESLDQPGGFTLGGQPYAGFEDAEDKTVSSTAYKVYLQSAAVALTHDEGNGLSYGVTV